MKTQTRVTFSAADTSKRKFDCRFASDATLDNFVKQFQHIGGFRRFEYDIWGKTTDETLPLMKNNTESFKRVYAELYQKR